MLTEKVSTITKFGACNKQKYFIGLLYSISTGWGGLQGRVNANVFLNMDIKRVFVPDW